MQPFAICTVLPHPHRAFFFREIYKYTLLFGASLLDKTHPSPDRSVHRPSPWILLTAAIHSSNGAARGGGWSMVLLSVQFRHKRPTELSRTFRARGAERQVGGG